MAEGKDKGKDKAKEEEVQIAWVIVPVAGQGQVRIAAVSLAVAVKIAQLAYPTSDIGTAGYAKHQPCKGELVIIQVAPAELGKDPCEKDVAEACRRGDVNYECRCY